jgi:hypothetical protein
MVGSFVPSPSCWTTNLGTRALASTTATMRPTTMHGAKMPTGLQESAVHDLMSPCHDLPHAHVSRSPAWSTCMRTTPRVGLHTPSPARPTAMHAINMSSGRCESALHDAMSPGRDLPRAHVSRPPARSTCMRTTPRAGLHTPSLARPTTMQDVNMSTGLCESALHNAMSPGHDLPRAHVSRPPALSMCMRTTPSAGLHTPSLVHPTTMHGVNMSTGLCASAVHVFMPTCPFCLTHMSPGLLRRQRACVQPPVQAYTTHHWRVPTTMHGANMSTGLCESAVHDFMPPCHDLPHAHVARPPALSTCVRPTPSAGLHTPSLACPATMHGVNMSTGSFEGGVHDVMSPCHSLPRAQVSRPPALLMCMCSPPRGPPYSPSLAPPPPPARAHAWR